MSRKRPGEIEHPDPGRKPLLDLLLRGAVAEKHQLGFREPPDLARQHLRQVGEDLLDVGPIPAHQTGEIHMPVEKRESSPVAKQSLVGSRRGAECPENARASSKQIAADFQRAANRRFTPASTRATRASPKTTADSRLTCWTAPRCQGRT